jgi:hypothetical protein
MSEWRSAESICTPSVYLRERSLQIGSAAAALPTFGDAHWVVGSQVRGEPDLQKISLSLSGRPKGLSPDVTRSVDV